MFLLSGGKNLSGGADKMYVCDLKLPEPPAAKSDHGIV